MLGVYNKGRKQHAYMEPIPVRPICLRSKPSHACTYSDQMQFATCNASATTASAQRKGV